jgi:hypothetical protein
MKTLQKNLFRKSKAKFRERKKFNEVFKRTYEKKFVSTLRETVTAKDHRTSQT